MRLKDECAPELRVSKPTGKYQGATYEQDYLHRWRRRYRFGDSLLCWFAVGLNSSGPVFNPF